jgi:hypothetical protein
VVARIWGFTWLVIVEAADYLLTLPNTKKNLQLKDVH